MPLAIQQPRRFVMPPPVIPGGPPALTPEELQPGYDQGPSLVPPGGPPVATPEQQADSVAAVTSPMASMTPQDRTRLATAGLPAEPYQPEPQALALPTPPALMKPGPKRSGLKAALEVILPIARDLVAGTAAGASSPTAIGGAGAGLQEQMALEQHRQGLAAAQQKQAIEWRKLQLEQEKNAAEIEERTARAGNLRGQTAQQPSRLALDQERYRAQAEASRAAAEHSRAQAVHERAIAQQFPEKSAAEIKELASRAALHDVEAQKFKEYIAAGVDSATARLRAQEAARAGAQAHYYEEQAKLAPQKVQNETTRAGAYAQQAQAALSNARQKLQAGSLKPTDVEAGLRIYYNAIKEINSDFLAPPDVKQARQQELEKNLKEFLPGGLFYNKVYQQASNPASAGGPPAITPPAAVDANPYR